MTSKEKTLIFSSISIAALVGTCFFYLSLEVEYRGITVSQQAKDTRVSNSQEVQPEIQEATAAGQSLKTIASTQESEKSQIVSPADSQAPSEDAQRALESARKDWMQSAGILTPAQQVQYYSMTLEELNKLALQADPLAKEVLGMKLAFSGDSAAGVAILEEAVIEGSMGAALALANLYSGSSMATGFPTDRIAAYAWFNVAKSMGSVSSIFLDSSSVRTMNADDAARAQLFSSLLLQRLQEDSLTRFGQPLPYYSEPVLPQLSKASRAAK